MHNASRSERAFSMDINILNSRIEQAMALYSRCAVLSAMYKTLWLYYIILYINDVRNSLRREKFRN